MDAREELKCPVCADPFTDPVNLPCSHNFCQSCIQIVWNMDELKSSKEIPLFCPECQILLPPDVKLEVNSDLQRRVLQVFGRPEGESQPMILCDQCIGKPEVAVKSCLSCDASLCSAHTLLHQQREALRGHSLIEVTKDLISFKCKEHGEELKLFCQEEQTAVCSLCIAVGSHKNHQAVTLQEASLGFKKLLETDRTLLLLRKHLAECALQDLGPLFLQVTKNAEAYRLRIIEKYAQIKAQIEEDQKLMLSILETEEFYSKKWLIWRRESLQGHVRDINTALSSSQSLLDQENHIIFLQRLKRHGRWSQMNLPLVPLVEQECSLSVKMETVEKLVDNLQEVITQNTQRLWSIFRSLNLDPETAHPELEVSGDRLEVHWCKKQTLEKVKISSQYSVLAKERFSTGAHYWEVAVWKKPYWLIGLSYGSAAGDLNCDFSNGFCYIYHGNGSYLICKDSDEKPLIVKKFIQKLGVRVDVQNGAVSFYDGDTLALLHSFSRQFSGPVYPILNPCIDVNGQNSQPLAIVTLKRRIV